MPDSVSGLHVLTVHRQCSMFHNAGTVWLLHPGGENVKPAQSAGYPAVGVGSSIMRWVLSHACIFVSQGRPARRRLLWPGVCSAAIAMWCSVDGEL